MFGRRGILSMQTMMLCGLKDFNQGEQISSFTT